MKQLRLSEIEHSRRDPAGPWRGKSHQPNPKDRYNQLWNELSELKEPARKGTKLHREWQSKKERLLAELDKIERELEGSG